MKLCAVLMASGRGKRFGGDKLFFDCGGAPLIERALSSVPEGVFSRVSVVARSPAVLELARARGFFPVPNGDLTDDVAVTVRLGMESLPEDAEGCMFLVCDQPWLRAETVEKLALNFSGEPQRIWALSHQERRGNPVIFPRALFAELRCLPFDKGGRAVIQRHPELLSLMETSARELEDMDYPPDTPYYSKGAHDEETH